VSTQVRKEIELEIAHVLFIDIVGYSKRLVNEQRALRDTLNHIVRGTKQFRKLDRQFKSISFAVNIYRKLFVPSLFGHSAIYRANHRVVFDLRK
jgi:hypothetical protein